MKAQFPSLVRFYVISTYGLRGNPRGGAPSAPAREEGRAGTPMKARSRAKAVAKTIGIAALAVLLAADIGGVFFAQNWAMYRALKTAGLQGLLILNATTTASLLVFFLGFATALSTYTMSTAESFLLSLPVRPRHLLGAKICTVYLSEFVFAFLLMSTALGVYAWGERPAASFYVMGALGVLALPLLPIAFSYLVLVPLMTSARFLRNKNAVLIMGGVVGLAFALVFNFLFQSAASHMQDAAWLLANYAGSGGLLARAGKVYLPGLLLWHSVNSGWLEGIGFSLLNLAVGLGSVVVVACALGPAYASGLSRFGEMRLKKLASVHGFLGRRLRRSGLRRALFDREFRLMNREPVYFLNGPFVPILMPIIAAVALVAQGANLRELTKALASLGGTPYLMLIAAGIGAFLGSSTSITCTAVSRDAKALSYLKALPVPPEDYGMAKFLHGFTFAAYGAVLGGLGLGLGIGLDLPRALGAAFIALAISGLINVAGLWLDTANPWLEWDNPTAALKRNPNAVIVILGAMALIGSLGVLAANLRLGVLGFLCWFGLLPAAIAAAALAAYPRYMARRLAVMET